VIAFIVLPGIGEAQIVNWIPGGSTSGTLRDVPPAGPEALARLRGFAPG
jgi:hypothetical protein